MRGKIYAALRPGQILYAIVMGALCRKTDTKIATIVKTHSRSKDPNDKR